MCIRDRVSNRYDAYNSKDHAHTLTAEGRRVPNSNARLLFAGREHDSVSRLQTYADRFLRGEQGGRLIIDSSAGRTNEIKKMANDSAAAVAREKAAIAAAARKSLDKAIDMAIDIGIQDYAKSIGITATEQNRNNLNEQRLAAVRQIEEKALINAKSVEYRPGGIWRWYPRAATCST